MTVHEMRYAGSSSPLRNGTTTLTIRLADEWGDVDTGETLEMVTDDGTVRMTVEETRTVTATDAYIIANACTGHVSYQSLGAFLGAFRRYYPEADVGPATRMACFSITPEGGIEGDSAESIEVVE